MIEGILAEWFSKQPKEIQEAYFVNGIAYTSMETLRASMTMLFNALRAEGLHVYHCRRVVNRMLYGTPEPDGVAGLGERLMMLQPTAFSFSGQLTDDAAAENLLRELGKIGEKQEH